MDRVIREPRASRSDASKQLKRRYATHGDSVVGFRGPRSTATIMLPLRGESLNRTHIFGHALAAELTRFPLALPNTPCSLSRKEAALMTILLGVVFGFVAWFLVRYLAAGFYTVNQNERAVKTSFGRAERVGDATTLEGSHRRVA